METRNLAVSLLRGAGRVASEHRRLLLLMMLGVLVGTAALMFHDRAWSDWITTDRREPWLTAARKLSFWGDYPTGQLLLCIGLWAAGWWRKRYSWRVAALAALLSSTCAGLEVNIVRMSTGRARPRTETADHWIGPTLNARYASFPSAHTATAFGLAGALVGVMPPVGTVATIGAAGVGWSRLYNKAHYPADVWTSVGVGLLNGFVFAKAARRLLRPVVHPQFDPTGPRDVKPGNVTPFQAG